MVRTDCDIYRPEVFRRGMGWNFRRSVSIGPFRMNFSKSGIGYSVGMRGLRLGRDAKGRKYSSVSVPHTGIYRRDYYSSPKQQVVPQQQLPQRVPQQPTPGIQWGSIVRSPWLVYTGAGVLLYVLIRAVF